MSSIGLCLATQLLYGADWVLNNPYPASQSLQSIYYSSFSEQPKTLDPAKAYTSNEYLFINQIYEPLLAFDYFARPYKLVPLTAAMMPRVTYLDAHKNPLFNNTDSPSYSVYTLQLQKGIYYQPHPALATDQKGQYLYHNLPEEYLDEHHINQLTDFLKTGTREVVSDDYIYQIKRLADPSVGAPIYGLMKDYILGFGAYGKQLPQHGPNKRFLDLRQYPLEGVRKIDDYCFEITLKGQYSQFLFWLAMPFFSPVPWEADLFYSQANMDDKNLSFGWYPIGSGPFMLTKNNPNRHMILEKNPHFREVLFPSNATEQDKQQGYTKNAGKRIPLVDKAIYVLEKESIPRWNKFLQGYYDISSIGSDSFDQAIRINSLGELSLTPEMIDKNIRLTRTMQASIFYVGFNMLDKKVGGTSERARQLRQAISIAINYEEYIAIFYNGRGIASQGPLPPGIYGYKDGEKGINPYVYEWNNGQPKRKSLDYAKQLMKEAGYPNGVDPTTGKALILNYDVASTSNPQDKSILDWMRKQFANIGIDLNVRATLYNRFQEKMRHGDAQIFTWGWSADYPDPENFLFQLYGRNSKVLNGGENATNYQNPEFDRLFDLMKNRSDDTQRMQLIEQMLAMVRYDAPWVWGYHSEEFTLTQDWVSPVKQNPITVNTLKYLSIDLAERNKHRTLWNQPILWPLVLVLLLLVSLCIPLVFAYYKKENQKAARMNND